MFVCEVCGSVAPPCTPCNRVAVETREVEYPRRKEAHWHPPSTGGKGKWIDDPGGSGTEIARELSVCGPCAAKLSALDRTGEDQPARA